MGALVTAFLLGLIATITASSQEIPPASYSASVTPDTCEAEFACDPPLKFTVTNESPPDSGSLMDKATIKAPSGFSNPAVVSVTVQSFPAKNWIATANGDTVTLTANSVLDGLAPTESVSVTVNTTPSLATVGPDNIFVTTASGSNPVLGTTNFHNNDPDPTVTVVNEQVNCDPAPAPGCETETVTLGNTSAQATASQGATNETLTLSVGGTFPDPASKCFDPTFFTPKGEAVTTNVTGNDRSHIVTLTLSKTVNNSPGAPGAERFQICVSADSPFPTKDGTIANEGLLPDCPPIPITKCVLSRTRNAGNSIIRYFIDPGDPISIPGLG